MTTPTGRPATSSSPRWPPARTGRSRWPSMTAVPPARPIPACCPSTEAALTSINTSLRAYKDSGTSQGAVPVGGNVRISAFTWDPEQPGQTIDGIDQMACASHDDPCTVAFIGDYFGLAISGGNIYALMVSTHYPSGVTADDGGPVYYQQQVLATVPRTQFGAGY